MPFHGFHHAFSFANSTGHGFFAENVFPRLGCFNCHNAVPMGWRGNMNDIHVLVENQIAKIVIKGYFVFYQSGGLIQVVFVHIAHGHYTRTVVGNVIASHAANTDNSFRQLVTGSYHTSTQHITRHNGQQCHTSDRL